MALSPTEESLVRQLIAQNPALLNLASSESTIISKLGATKVSLSDLSAATSLSDADLALVRQGLNDKSFAMSVLLDYVGNNLTLPAASETVAGIIEIATTAEAQALTDDTKALTPKKLADALDVTALGRNQTWQDVTASRTASTTYTNTTGRPILAVVSIDNSVTTRYFKINGNNIARFTTISSGTISSVITALVMPGDTYSVDGWSALWSWWELR